ncbi:hypothetical protein KIN20_030366 [Parelaphostrongylus tenuis]|uniref:Uncharacterized protein n=1 Tax=Parelaphostrongylus tenuis TaxID=148309 RepID=A0AAD5R4P9_PARTN|nr:hypothetical protein KIN20_030366 [Parelaphostrongylus tenuis]
MGNDGLFLSLSGLSWGSTPAVLHSPTPENTSQPHHVRILGAMGARQELNPPLYWRNIRTSPLGHTIVGSNGCS